MSLYPMTSPNNVAYTMSLSCVSGLSKEKGSFKWNTGNDDATLCMNILSYLRCALLTRHKLGNLS